MEKSHGHPEKLYIYECHGPSYPQNEPSCEGFLGVWPEPPYYYLFFDRPVHPLVHRWLEDQPEWSLGGTYQMDYRQWQQTTLRDQRIGPFVIRMGVSPTDPLEEGIPIRLNTGLSFGSGLHPSTKGCLLSIADLYAQTPPANVVDLGTGTGILAIACARLGAQKVLALDCNFLAVREARTNVQTNRLEDSIQLLVTQTLDTIRSKGDLLLMNIEWPCLQKVLREDDRLRYRWVVLSGFLRSQEEELRRLIPCGSSVISRKLLEDWVTLVVKNEIPGF